MISALPGRFLLDFNLVVLEFIMDTKILDSTSDYLTRFPKGYNDYGMEQVGLNQWGIELDKRYKLLLDVAIYNFDELTFDIAKNLFHSYLLARLYCSRTYMCEDGVFTDFNLDSFDVLVKPMIDSLNKLEKGKPETYDEFEKFLTEIIKNNYSRAEKYIKNKRIKAKKFGYRLDEYLDIISKIRREADAYKIYYKILFGKEFYLES